MLSILMMGVFLMITASSEQVLASSMFYLLSVLFMSVKEFSYSSNFYNSIVSQDLVFYWMSLMTMTSMYLAFKSACASSNKISSSLTGLINSLTLIVVLVFVSENILIFYVMFEFSIIPIFLMILGWGYQPERSSASLALFFYTATCSVPLLMFISFMNMNWGSVSLLLVNQMGFLAVDAKIEIFAIMLLLGFLVKVPIYGLHLWLPKAHVEAPVYGSMILAAVLLKLGGLGLVRVAMLSSNKFIYIFNSVCVLSMAAVGALCAYLFDMKMVVAYSSVAHMSLVILAILSFTKFSLVAGVLMMISHAFASSALFFGVTKIYTQAHSRSLILNNGNLSLTPKFSAAWMFVVMASMATPPLVNFFAEMTCLLTVGLSVPSSYPFLLLAISLAGAYSLILYNSTSQGKNVKSVKSLSPILSLDFLIIFNHSVMFFTTIFLLVQIF